MWVMCLPEFAISGTAKELTKVTESHNDTQMVAMDGDTSLRLCPQKIPHTLSGIGIKNGRAKEWRCERMAVHAMTMSSVFLFKTRQGDS